MTVLLGGNRFTDCQHLIGFLGQPMLQVLSSPLRVELRTPEGPPTVSLEVTDGKTSDPNTQVVMTDRSFSIFSREHALAIATQLDAATVHLKLDLRPLGIRVFDDVDGLHVGSNVFSGNELDRVGVAINLA